MLQTRFHYLTFVFMMNTTMKVGKIFCEIKEKLYSEFINQRRKKAEIQDSFLINYTRIYIFVHLKSNQSNSFKILLV